MPRLCKAERKTKGALYPYRSAFRFLPARQNYGETEPSSGTAGPCSEGHGPVACNRDVCLSPGIRVQP